MWKLRPPLEMPLATKYKSVLEQRMPKDPMSLIKLKRLSPEEEFPDLNRNYTCMARILTLQMYKRQYGRASESGFTFDDVIRPGLEDPGGPCSEAVGCVAGDAHCYIIFCDFFDRIIELYHHGYKMTMAHKSDFNYENLKGGDDFDSQYVLSCEVRAGRNVEEFSFPPHCSRGERRQLESLAKQAFTQLSQELPGTYYSLKDLSEDRQELLDAGVSVDSPSLVMMKTGVARDWPDARGVWISQDTKLIVWINNEDHLQLEDLYKKMKHPFIWKDHLGYVLSSPAEVGTGLRACCDVKLSHIHKHDKFENIMERLRLRKSVIGAVGSSVYKIFNADTIGFTEVELLQLLVDGVKLLINMDKNLKQGSTIDHLMPAPK
ncbi:zgc:172076 isoform X2 [Polyodon spathula]|uniref:zgc:172076 isoform X2 n=1 Tax=Polyodon spathula TaxID=7913 RepID=UPI001B7F379E|nr:zgc:172076 isoform X2 [Polyodon spathula]